jgi:hypothetical protein
MEQQLVEAFEEVISDINAELVEIQIRPTTIGHERGYSVADRTLAIHFFKPGELYHDPLVPGRMATLREHCAVHGGYVEIRDRSGEREGWNIVLVKTPEKIYGTWVLVETELSALTGRATRYSPIATEAQLFADIWHVTG